MTTVQPVWSCGSKLPAVLALTLAVILAAGCGEDEEEPRPAWHDDRSGVQEDQWGRGDPMGQGKRPGSGAQHRVEEPDQGQSGRVIGYNGTGRHSPSIAPGGTQRMSSTGVGVLSFTVARPSRLAWRSTPGKRFAASGPGVSIHSSKGRGEVGLRPGNYDLSVRGAPWTIVVRERRPDRHR